MDPSTNQGCIYKVVSGRISVTCEEIMQVTEQGHAQWRAVLSATINSFKWPLQLCWRFFNESVAVIVHKRLGNGWYMRSKTTLMLGARCLICVSLPLHFWLSNSTSNVWMFAMAEVLRCCIKLLCSHTENALDLSAGNIRVLHPLTNTLSHLINCLYGCTCAQQLHYSFCVTIFRSPMEKGFCFLHSK